MLDCTAVSHCSWCALTHPLHTSTHPLNTPYQLTFSTHPINTPTRHLNIPTPSSPPHPFNPPHTRFSPLFLLGYMQVSCYPPPPIIVKISMVIRGVTSNTSLALTGPLSASVKKSVLAAVNMGGAALVPAKNVVILGLTVTTRKRRLAGENDGQEEETHRAVGDLTGDLTGEARRRFLASTVAVTASYSVTSTTLSSTAVSSLINAGQSINQSINHSHSLIHSYTPSLTHPPPHPLTHQPYPIIAITSYFQPSLATPSARPLPSPVPAVAH